MNAVNWNTVKEIFNKTIELPEDERHPFLKKVCSHDPELLHDVEELLDSFDSEFMEQPAVAEVADFIVGNEERLKKGDRLDHYEIVELLGAGGMGEVYLADDTKLNRQVAIKLLPPVSVSDPQANRRFLLEAQAAAIIDHPNICAIHEIGESEGRSYIVMQYIEGETLADKIRPCPLPVNEALRIAVQIADALSEAHSRGVVHRDIKPSNVMINARGQAKVLDFSLARKTIIQSEDTTQEGLSQQGVIVGTVTYMSPEQVRAKKIDARSDIWSLGVVMYEMLTGRPPFKGETSSDTIAAILHNEPPPISKSGRQIPVGLERVVRKALAKDRKLRYQTSQDLLLDLNAIGPDTAEEFTAPIPNSDPLGRQSATEQQRYPFTGEQDIPVTGEREISSDRTSIPPPQTAGISRYAPWIAAACVLFAIAIGGVVIWQRRAINTAATPPALTRTEITSWKNELGLQYVGRARFSPDGKMIAFSANRNGRQAIWLKQLEGGDPFTLKKESEDSIDTDPVFSPDGQQIAFISRRGEKTAIYTMPTFGGTSQYIRDVDGVDLGLLAWSKDGSKIYFSSNSNAFTLNLSDKTASQLTNFDPDQLIGDLSISPDDEKVAYFEEINGQSDVKIFSATEAASSAVTNDVPFDHSPIWHPDGERLIYNSERNGVLQIFETSKSANAQPTQLTLGDVSTNVNDVSPDGKKILYQTERDESDIWRLDFSTGREIAVAGEPDVEIWPNISPDGQKITFQSFPDSSPERLLKGNIFVGNIGNSNKRLLTADGFYPSLSPDGKYVAYLKQTEGADNISMWVSPTEGGQESQITQGSVISGGYSPLPLNQIQVQSFQWSNDGKSIFYIAKRDGIYNVWKAATDGSSDLPVSDNTESGWSFVCPILSPDGEHIAWIGTKKTDSSYESAVFALEKNKMQQIFVEKKPIGLIGWISNNEIIVRSSVNMRSANESSTADVSLYKLRTDGRDKPRLIKALPKSYLRNIKLSPDKSAIAFVDRLDGTDTLRILSIASGQIRQVAKNDDSRVYYSALTWAPDGKSIFYSKHAKWTVVSMLDNLN